MTNPLDDLSVAVDRGTIKVYAGHGRILDWNADYRVALLHVRAAIDAELAQLDTPDADLDQLHTKALDDLLAWFASTEPHDVFPAAQLSARAYLDARGTS